jgi:hypothetical protein
MYKWALSMVYSRAVGINKNGEYTRCIPPVIDMANHNMDIGRDIDDTLNFDSDTNEVIFLNKRNDISAGEECCAIYGKS